jgi:hypothetical protein
VDEGERGMRVDGRLFVVILLSLSRFGKDFKLI